MIDVRLPRLLDAELSEKARLEPISLSITERIDPLSTASMTLERDAPTVRTRDFVELYTIRGSAGIYRASSVYTTYTGKASIELEHGSCVLGDAVIPGEGKLEGTAAHVLQTILGYQTAKIKGQNAWKLGKVEATGNVVFEYRYHNVLSAVCEVCASLDGYMLKFDQSSFPWTVSLVKKETVPSCEGRLSRNIQGLGVTLDDSDLCTRLYCQQLPEPGYMDGSQIGTWGVVCKTLNSSDNVTPESLKKYVTRYLDEHKEPKITVEVDADDLSAETGEPLDRFECGKLCRIALPDYGVTVEERIVSMHTGGAFGDPLHVRLSLANNILDTAKELVYLQNTTDGGVSHNSTGGGGYRGGGSGMSQQSILDSLHMSDMTIEDQKAILDQAGVTIAAQGVEIYSTQKSITGLLGTPEDVHAFLDVTAQNGGLIQALVGRKTSTEEIEAGLKALGAGGGSVELFAQQKTKIDENTEKVKKVSVDLDAANEQITLRAKKIDLDALITKVNNLMAGDVSSKLLITNDMIINGNLRIGYHNAFWKTLDVVTGVSLVKRSAMTPDGHGTVNFYAVSNVQKESLTVLSGGTA